MENLYLKNKINQSNYFIKKNNIIEFEKNQT